MALEVIAEVIEKGLTSLFGSRNQRLLEEMAPIVDLINALEPEFEVLTDAQLMAKTVEFRERLAAGETLDDILPEAFAAVRESSKRYNYKHERHFDVQLIGGMVLHRGAIAEMVTGEGKTLVATLAAYLNALLEKGVHVVTVNDYLAKRDRDWMGPVYEGLGMTCGVIYHGMDEIGSNEKRKLAYRSDITYGTNSQFGFDYLYDNMKPSLEAIVQRGHHYAIIDEVDSILIDEARTPLIISGEAEESTDKYYVADKVAKKLSKDTHYEVKEKEHQVILSDEGLERAEHLVGVGSFYDAANMEWPHLINQALVANALYKRDRTHVVKEGEVIIVDEFTGRLMPGRRWSDGLHQAVEAMEGIKIREEQQTLATVTIQNYFRMYEKLAGMTGTAITEAAEFMKIYKLDVVVVPTNRPLRRSNFPDRVYASEKEKFDAIIAEVVRLHEEGRPVLVGTVSIENSEILSNMLKVRGIKNEVLNAKHHEREAAIVAKAGQMGNATIATNMAGRGTDIELGEGVPQRGGLAIIGTERHEARRIDNQLRGRAGRQGDPGTSVFFLSFEDTLMRKMLRGWANKFMQRVASGQEITSPIVTRQIAKAQSKMEEFNFSIRKNLLEYDEVMDTQRKTIYALRRQILEARDIRAACMKMLKESLFDKIDGFLPKDAPRDEWDYDGLAAMLRSTFRIEAKAEELAEMPFKEMENHLVAELERAFENKVADDVAAAKDAGYTEAAVEAIHQYIVLETIDKKWKEHLRYMDFLRSSVGLRGYAQKDPKIEYKIEGFEEFARMTTAVANEVSDLLFKFSAKPQEKVELRRRPAMAGRAVHEEYSAYVDNDDGARTAGGAASGEKLQPFRREAKKVGRNEPCPCGSGRKYKACCGR